MIGQQSKEPPKFSQPQINFYMSLALQQAKQASSINQVPVGCIFVSRTGTIIAQSHNLTNQYKNASRHCEINCITEMEKGKGEGLDLSDVVLFVTVEPCIMCAYALNLVKIGMVYFGQWNQRFGGCGSVLQAAKFLFQGGIMEKQSLEILKTFYERGNQNIPEELRNKARKKVKKDQEPQKDA